MLSLWSNKALTKSRQLIKYSFVNINNLCLLKTTNHTRKTNIDVKLKAGKFFWGFWSKIIAICCMSISILAVEALQN